MTGMLMAVDDRGAARVSRASSARAYLLIALCLLLGLFWPKESRASITCPNPVSVTYTTTVNPQNYSGPRTAGTIVGRGVITMSVTCNSTGNRGGYPQLGINIGASSARASGVRGISMQLNGSPSQSFNSGCYLDSHQSGTGWWAWNFDRTTAGACSITASYEVVFRLTGEPVGVGNIWGDVNAQLKDWQTGANPAGFVMQQNNFAQSLPSPVASLNTTCNVTNSAIAVNLPRVQRTALPANGSTAGVTPFSINLSGCTFPSTPGTPYTAYAYFTFTQGSAANRIANSAASPAANVNAQILNSAMTPIANNGAATVTVSAAGGYTIPLFARYISGGAAGAGAYSGQVTFSMAYL